MVHLDADPLITMFVTIGSLIADSLIATGPTFSFVIIAVSFSVSTSLFLLARHERKGWSLRLHFVTPGGVMPPHFSVV